MLHGPAVIRTESPHIDVLKIIEIKAGKFTKLCSYNFFELTTSTLCEHGIWGNESTIEKCVIMERESDLQN